MKNKGSKKNNLMIQLNTFFIGFILLIFINLSEATKQVQQQIIYNVTKKEQSKGQTIALNEGSNFHPQIKIIQTRWAYIPQIDQNQYSIVNNIIYPENHIGNHFVTSVPKDKFIEKLKQKYTNKPLDQKIIQTQPQTHQKKPEQEKETEQKQQQIQQKLNKLQEKDQESGIKKSKNDEKELKINEQQNKKVQQHLDQNEKQKDKDQKLDNQAQTQQKEQTAKQNDQARLKLVQQLQKQQNLFYTSVKEQLPQIQKTDRTIKFKQGLITNPSGIKNYAFEMTKNQQKKQLIKQETQVKAQGTQVKKQQDSVPGQKKQPTDKSQIIVQKPKWPQAQPKEQTLLQHAAKQKQPNLRDQKQPQKKSEQQQGQKRNEQPTQTPGQQQPNGQQGQPIPSQLQATISPQSLTQKYYLLKKALSKKDQQLTETLAQEFVRQLKDQGMWKLNAVRAFVWIMIILVVFKAACRNQENTVQQDRFIPVSQEMRTQGDMLADKADSFK